MQKNKHWLFTIVVFILCCFVVFPLFATSLKKPNELEKAYYAIATAMEDPELCYKISPKAGGTAGANPKGSQISTLRSDCFQLSAIKTKDESLCNEVKEAKILFLDGSDTSRESCKKLIQTS